MVAVKQTSFIATEIKGGIRKFSHCHIHIVQGFMHPQMILKHFTIANVKLLVAKKNPFVLVILLIGLNQ